MPTNQFAYSLTGARLASQIRPQGRVQDSQMNAVMQPATIVTRESIKLSRAATSGGYPYYSMQKSNSASAIRLPDVM